MGRLGRSVRVALVAAMAFVPGPALAQTTTTSVTSTSTSTSVTSTSTSTSTLAPTTTSSTPAHPCTGQPCTDRPPQLLLSAASGQIQADQDGYCWLLPTQLASTCMATSRTEDYKAPLLVVTEGETVTLRFTAPAPGAPRQVSLTQRAERTPLAAANPTTFRVTLAPGVHDHLGVASTWLQGDASHGFRLDVRRAAAPADPSAGRRIALTG